MGIGKDRAAIIPAYVNRKPPPTRIDTEDQSALAGAARITSIPTLMAFRDGILVSSQPGALPAAALEQVIQAVRDLDMDDIRDSLAQQEQEASR